MSAADPLRARLGGITERLAAATPGPWHAVTTGVRGGDHWFVCDDGESLASIACRDGVNEDQREPDARFIAAAPSDLAATTGALLAVLALHRSDEHPTIECCVTCKTTGWPCATYRAVAAHLDPGETT